MNLIKFITTSFASTVLFFISSLSTQALPASYDVGMDNGSFSVNNNGQGAWIMPITAPPGPGALTPQIALQLSTSPVNGIAGQGGQLIGLSSITRCGKTIAQDGFNAAVQLSQTDGYCFDGNRLMLISGNYGGDGSEYRTELETFNKIIARSSAGGAGPQYFEATNRNGATMIFGAYTSAVLDASSGAIVEWKVSSFTDPNGNTIHYTYKNKSIGGGNELLLESIRYGGNASAGIVDHLAITFSYEDRPDASSGYALGAKFNQSQRLVGIATIHDNDVVRSYKLTYAAEAEHIRSKVASVQECGGNGSCYPPTVFNYTPEMVEWKNTTGQYVEPAKLRTSAGLMRGTVVDVNNDGWNDWVVSVVERDGREEVATHLGGPNGWHLSPNWELPAFLFDYSSVQDGIATAHFADVNGDGWVDILEAFQDSKGTVKNVWINTGSGWRHAPSIIVPDVLMQVSNEATPANRSLLADVNGDGRVDIVVSTKNAVGVETRKTWINNGTGWTIDAKWTPPAVADYSIQGKEIILCSLLDINGDGLPDWVQSGSTPQYPAPAKVWINTGSSWQLDSRYTLPMQLVTYGADLTGKVEAALTDINGDGQADFVRAVTNADGTKSSSVQLNTGRGWLNAPEYVLPESLVQNRPGDKVDNLGSLADLDGNGTPEFVQSYKTTAGTIVSRVWRKNLGSGWQEVSGLAPPAPLFTHASTQISSAPLDSADLNGDNTPELFISRQGLPAQFFQKQGFANGRTPGMLESVTNGLGLTTRIVYGLSTDNSCYNPTGIAGSRYPLIANNRPTLLVKSLLTSDGMGGAYQVDHQYGEARVHLQGRGNVGFAWHAIKDRRSNFVIHNDFHQEFPFIGMSKSTTKDIDGTSNSLTLAEVTSTVAKISLNNNKTVYPYIAEVATNNYDLDGAILSASTKRDTIDDYGNTTQSQERVTSGGETVTNTITTDFFNLTSSIQWRLGLPARITAIIESPQRGKQVKELRNEYDHLGRLTREILEPSLNHLVSEHVYDEFGNKVRTIIRGGSYPERIINVRYNQDGRFPAKTLNSLGHETITEYDGRFGVLTKSISPNGKTTIYSHDAHGVKINERIVDSSDATADSSRSIARYWCDSGRNCPTNAKFLIATIDTSQTSQEAPVAAYIDALGREIQSVTYGLDGKLILQDTQYDAFGRKSKVSTPYFKEGGTPKWATTQYDILDRITSQTAMDGVVTTYRYQGNIQIANQSGRVTKVIFNGQGKPVESVDAAGNTTRFTYDIAGNLLTTTDPHGNVSLIEYDRFGRKVLTRDPDMGEWRYMHDPFGNVVKQTDAKGQQVFMEYDALNRLVRRTTPEGATTWIYDTAEHGLGQLARVLSPDGYAREVRYDSQERPVKTVTTIGKAVYATETSYLGATDKVATITYPTGVHVRNTFDQWGNLINVQSENQALRQEYETTAHSAEQLTTQAQKMETDTKVRRSNLQNAYGTAVAQLKPYQDRIQAYQNEYNKTVSAATSATNNANDYNGLVSYHYNLYKVHEAHYHKHLGLLNQYTAAMSLSRRFFKVQFRAQERLIDQERTLVNYFATQMNTAAANAQANANYRDGWLTTLAAHNARINTLTALMQQEDAAMKASVPYKLAMSSKAEYEYIVTQMNNLVDRANATTTSANNLYSTYIKSVVSYWQAKETTASMRVSRTLLGNGVESARSYDAMDRPTAIVTTTPQHPSRRFKDRPIP